MELVGSAQITMKYKEVGSFEFQQVLQKIANTPTQASKANLIRKVVKGVMTVREKMAADYKTEIMEVYAVRNEDGSIKRPEGEPEGFEPMPDKMEELTKATEAFGEKEIALEGPRITASLITDMKVSAKELDALKSYFADDDGPGLPPGVHHN